MAPLLEVRDLRKIYRRGLLRPRQTFSLHADFRVTEPQIIGVMGPNGAGKTTLFELLSGSNVPTSGNILCNGTDIQRVRYHQRDRLVIHYHQSYQVRRVKKTVPSFMLDAAPSSYPLVHIFDEPQFSLQDGYVGFMLDFFKHLRATGRVVFLCIHPCEPFHLDILRANCERFMFVADGKVGEWPDLTSLLAEPRARDYLAQARSGGAASATRNVE